jgi:actin-related protein 3
VVYDIGHGVAHSVALLEYNPIEQSVRRNNFAGGEISKYLTNTLLNKCGAPPGGGSWHEPKWDPYVQELKETGGIFYVAEDYEAELTDYSQKDLEDAKLTDGRYGFGSVQYVVGTGYVRIGAQRIELAEKLFSPPAHMGSGVSPQQMVVDTINETGMDLWGSIYVTGGSTLFPGFNRRLEKEICKLVPPQLRDLVQVKDHGYGKMSVYWGAVALVSEWGNDAGRRDANMVTREEHDNNLVIKIEAKFR